MIGAAVYHRATDPFVILLTGRVWSLGCNVRSMILLPFSCGLEIPTTGVGVLEQTVETGAGAAHPLRLKRLEPMGSGISGKSGGYRLTSEPVIFSGLYLPMVPGMTMVRKALSLMMPNLKEVPREITGTPLCFPISIISMCTTLPTG